MIRRFVGYIVGGNIFFFFLNLYNELPVKV